MKQFTLNISKSKLTSLLLFLLFSVCGFAQQSSQALLESYGTSGVQEAFYKNSVLRSSDGFTYVCGATLNANGDYDMLLTKLNSSNVQVWSVTYAGAAGGDDFAADLVQDSGGNIIITGAEYISITNYNAVTIKYNNAGVQQWLETFNGAANSFDGGVAVVKDNSNNIYVCGGSFGASTLSDFLCIKYNSSGAQQWASTWNSVNLQDVAVRLAVNSSTVSVIGATQQNANDWKMATVRFAVSNGSTSAAQLTGGDDEGIDKVTDLAIDASDNTYIVGAVKNLTNGYDLKVMKLNASLVVLWQQTFNGADDLDDEGLSLEIDASNNVIVCGFTTTTSEGKNFITRKHNGTTGALIWSKTFDADDGVDEATGLKLDAAGNAIICGSSYQNGNLDYVVQKLKASNGDLIWTNWWNSDNNADDIPMNIAIDENDNNIYVAGQSSDGNGNFTYVVTRWSQKDVYMAVPTDGFSASGGYIQNRKQLRNDDGTANTSVKFYCQKNSPSTYIDNSRISYVFSSPKADTLETDTLHRVDMKFNKGVTNATVYPISERPEYANFYLGHMPKKAERTSIYNSVVKLGAYTNTDIIFDNNSSGYRHWIVARSGAPTGDFEMEYTGQNSLSIDGSGNLVIETAVGNQIQPKANVYTMNNTTGVLTLLGWQPDYTITGGNKVSFTNMGSWSGTLVIEMKRAAVGSGGGQIDNFELEWSTYFGDDGEDVLYDVVGEFTGRSWTVGSTSSSVFPLIPSISILNNLNSLSDALVTTFQPDCSVNWFTYFGGSLDDRATAIIRTDMGWPVVVGSTESDDLPDEADGPLDDSTLGGTKDGFILRLFPNGTIMLDSYIGGDGDDVIADVGFNMFGGIKDIYLVGSTDSDETTFPLISPAGAYNQPYAGTDPMNLNGDGFIMRINEVNNQPIWRTFFGTENGDRALRLSFAVNDLFVMGNTTCMDYSTDECDVPTDGLFPHCITGGSWENTDFENNNGYNYFIARFDKTTNALDWSTIVGPSPQSDFVGTNHSNGLASQSPTASSIYMTGFLPQADDESFPFVTSLGTNAYNQQEIYNSAAFLMRFRVEEGFSNLIWATAIDGQGHQEGATVSVSDDGTVYVAGDGSMQLPQEEADYCTLPVDNEFPICNESGDSYMEINVSSPPYRSFICAFNSDDQMMWSTFFGNYFRNNTYGSSCAGDYVFICGQADYPASDENPSWTLQEWDIESFTDYYQETHGGESDGSITRFERTLLIGINETELSNQSEIFLYPVPTSGMLDVLLPKEFAYDGSITVIDNMGRTVHTAVSNGRFTTLNLSELSCGNYVIRVTNNQGVLTKSFVKQ